MLEVNNLDVFFGEFQVLKKVSIEINEGEMKIILGPNGHGKSTLLKAICGLLKQVSGSIKFLEKDITRQPSEKIVQMGMTYIAEDRELFPEMTVLENLKLGAYNRNAYQLQSLNLKYVFELFPKLESMKKRLASNLSGGEARMLAIARGLMSNATFLAIDEPSLGLSPIFRNEVFNKVKEIHKNGTTVLLVESNIPQLIDIVDEVYILEEGQIVFSGNRDVAVNNPQVKEIFLGA